MGVRASLEPLAGTWTGVKCMRFMPADPFTDSPSTAHVTVTAHDLITISYSWSNQDGGQDGMLLIGDGSAPHEADAIWVDSFHQSPRWMVLQGTISGAAGVVLEGVYAAPPGPDWSWRISLGGPDLQLTMFNLPPGEAAYEAVRASYSRTRPR